MGFLIAFLGLFLLLLVALAFAAIKLFAVRGADGRLTAPGLAMGCLTGCALALIGVLGLTAFGLGVATISTVHSVSEAVESVPSFTMRAWRDVPAPKPLDADYPLHVVFEWRGNSEPTDRFLALLNKIDDDGDVRVRVEHSIDEPGGAAAHEQGPLTRVTLDLRADEHDLRELDDLVRELAPEFSEGQGVEVHVESVYEDKLR